MILRGERRMDDRRRSSVMSLNHNHYNAGGGGVERTPLSAIII